VINAIYYLVSGILCQRTGWCVEKTMVESMVYMRIRPASVSVCKRPTLQYRVPLCARFEDFHTLIARFAGLDLLLESRST
jgi:hypothetical protein